MGTCVFREGGRVECGKGKGTGRPGKWFLPDGSAGRVGKPKEIVYHLCPVVTWDATMEAIRQEPQAVERDGLRYAAGVDRTATEEPLASVREWLGQHRRRCQGVS